jgi:two-component system cell cycle sensor histidine kinase/response regulator CckA
MLRLRPTHEHGFSPREVHDIMDGIYARGDRLMLGFLVGHMALAILLAFYHQTWIATFTVGGAAVAAFALSARFLPRTFFTRALAGVAQQAFVALHIFQLYGQSEQHFWYFVAFTMMIVYQDWLCMWPGALLIIAQHSIFAGMHNAGLPVHFFPEAYVGFTKLFYHFGIALVHVALCGYWAHLLRLQTLGDAWQRRQLHEDQSLLEADTRRQRAILDNTTDLMWVKDASGRFSAVNTAFARAAEAPMSAITGKVPSELSGLWGPLDSGAQEAEAIRTRTPVTREAVGAAGDERVFEVTVTPIYDAQGAPAGVAGSARDVTERRRLLDAQRLESLGMLAGGVAHDFNNLLGVIGANAELARQAPEDAESTRESLIAIEEATRAASELTRQMLAYAGMGRVVTEVLNVSALVRGTAALLQTMVSKKATFRLELAEDLPTVEGDASQLRQMITNLVSNASDAVGNAGGVITLRTELVSLRRGDVPARRGRPELPPGTYVLIEVTDTGHGMDAGTQDRIFEPFFTTKFVGRGLGLAAVTGIVRAHRGGLDLTSEPGRGTAFRVYLPMTSTATIQAAGFEAQIAQSPNAQRSVGTVLIVDDEPLLRQVNARLIERAGFTVLQASDGLEALEILDATPGIAAVILDMMMPRMSGEETLPELRRRGHAMPVLLTSGFSEAVGAMRLLEGPAVAFIQKPYGSGKLVAALNELLARAQRGGIAAPTGRG